jgi:hypothetical protein
MKFSLHHLLAAVAIVAIYFQLLQVLADRREMARLEFLLSREYQRAVQLEKDFAPNLKLNTFHQRVLTSHQPPVDLQAITDWDEGQAKRRAAP